MALDIVLVSSQTGGETGFSDLKTEKSGLSFEIINLLDAGKEKNLRRQEKKFMGQKP